MGIGTGAAGVAAAAPIFLPIIKIGIYRKTKMEKKRMKSLFSYATVLPNSQVSSSLEASSLENVLFVKLDVCRFMRVMHS